MLYIQIGAVNDKCLP